MNSPFDGGLSFEKSRNNESELDLSEIENALNDLDVPLNLETAIELAEVLETKIKFGKEVTEEEQEKVLTKIAELTDFQNTAEAVGSDADDPKLIQTLVRLRKIKDTFTH